MPRFCQTVQKGQFLKSQLGNYVMSTCIHHRSLLSPQYDMPFDNVDFLMDDSNKILIVWKYILVFGVYRSQDIQNILIFSNIICNPVLQIHWAASYNRNKSFYSCVSYVKCSLFYVCENGILSDKIADKAKLFVFVHEHGIMFT